jgi:hypothetical protein
MYSAKDDHIVALAPESMDRGAKMQILDCSQSVKFVETKVVGLRIHSRSARSPHNRDRI